MTKTCHDPRTAGIRSGTASCRWKSHLRCGIAAVVLCTSVAVATSEVQAQAAIDKNTCAAPPCPELENSALEAFYWGQDKYYMRNPEWLALTKPRLIWPKQGEHVPTLQMELRSNEAEWVEFGRKHAEDLAKVGITVNAFPVSRQRYSHAGEHHLAGDILQNRSVMRPERVDPHEYLATRKHSMAQNNYGQYSNRIMDAIIGDQLRAGDRGRRSVLIDQAQAQLVQDYAFATVGWGPAILEAYNKDSIEGVKPISTFGLGALDLPWNLLEASAKQGDKRLTIGARALIGANVNPFGTDALDRPFARMIWDTFAVLDRDLNVVPWVAESWERVDDQTFDMTLRDGLKFHDGKPATVEDVKFTIDFMLRWDRGPYWAANRYLERVEIKDAAQRVVRFTFKQPYGQFETQFLVQNRILPKHIWEGIMERQGITNPLQVQLKGEEMVGTGPWKWTGFYKRDTELLLAANKEHFQAPKMDELLIVVVPSADGLLGRLQTGEFDWAVDAFLSSSQADQLKSSPHIEIVRSPDVNWLIHDLPNANMPWRDIEFRRAYMHMIDREYMVEVLWEGIGRMPTSNTFFAQGHPFHNENLPPIETFDLEKAKEILAAAGYAWDGDGKLVYPPPNNADFVRRVNQVTKNPGEWTGLKMMSPHP